MFFYIHCFDFYPWEEKSYGKSESEIVSARHKQVERQFAGIIVSVMFI